ncbi:hypothetical protein [Mycobacterium sp. DBP42]|uniref:hypothetical protein n=1 Tax=Mycobacterium sp. DBP42 TaxID=2545267 RepID=UPI00110D1B17|nr:hypothetical protein [Mycobacterium sp. DBP42]TMS50914.1 hypothetical protein E0T84_22105 [Mycobacterium sp. DBP42]
MQYIQPNGLPVRLDNVMDGTIASLRPDGELLFSLATIFMNALRAGVTSTTLSTWVPSFIDSCTSIRQYTAQILSFGISNKPPTNSRLTKPKSPPELPLPFAQYRRVNSHIRSAANACIHAANAVLESRIRLLDDDMIRINHETMISSIMSFDLAETELKQFEGTTVWSAFRTIQDSHRAARVLYEIIHGYRPAPKHGIPARVSDPVRLVDDLVAFDSRSYSDNSEDRSVIERIASSLDCRHEVHPLNIPPIHGRAPQTSWIIVLESNSPEIPFDLFTPIRDDRQHWHGRLMVGLRPEGGALIDTVYVFTQDGYVEAQPYEKWYLREFIESPEPHSGSESARDVINSANFMLTEILDYARRVTATSRQYSTEPDRVAAIAALSRPTFAGPFTWLGDLSSDGYRMLAEEEDRYFDDHSAIGPLFRRLIDSRTAAFAGAQQGLPDPTPAGRAGTSLAERRGTTT